jgi:deoxyribonuclease V
VSEEQAVELQERLASSVITRDLLAKDARLVAGVDVAYATGTNRVFSAVAVFDAATLSLIETATAHAQTHFPYIPGLFSFREIPAVMAAMENLKCTPDLLICDGHGVAHPRRFGLASHLGVLYDVPAIGCAKTRLIGQAGDPGRERGDRADLMDRGEVVGAVLRTQRNVKPVYVSAGHRISLDTACEWILRLSPRFRLPEPIRAADHAVGNCRGGL